MKLSLTLLITVLLAPLAALHASAAPKPNILVILADDLGYGDVSCYNDRAKVPTPNMDRLARGDTVHRCPQPGHCLHAHALQPDDGANGLPRPAWRLGLHGRRRPVAHFAGAAHAAGHAPRQGYATACIGKWHIGLTFFDKDGQPIHGNGVEAVQRVDFSRRIEGGPRDHGFDRFFGTACCPGTDWLYAFIEGDRVPVPPTRMIDKTLLPKHAYADDCRAGLIAPDFPLEEIDLVFLKKSREFLESHVRNAPGKPFFLYHATHAVHLPSFAAGQFKGKTCAGPHGDFIHELDYVVGELLTTLEKLGVADNTLVIFTSDNGPETTSVIHMRTDYGHDGARPWRGMKRDDWEGGHRVPFLVRWPGQVKPGTTSAQLTSLTDVMATVAAVVGADLPKDAAEDSFNMLPALLGQDRGPIRPYLLQQAFGGPRYLSIRRGHGNTWTTPAPAAIATRVIPVSSRSSSPTPRPAHRASSTTWKPTPAKRRTSTSSNRRS